MSAVSTDPAQTLDETDGRVGFSAWYIVGFLTIAASLSTIDRQALALMIGPIKRDLGITDSQMGLLGGLAFTLLYSVATLPAASATLKGARAFVTDATAPSFLAAVTGGGAIACPVVCNGGAWLAG